MFSTYSCCFILLTVTHTRYFQRNIRGTTKYLRPRGQSSVIILREINVSTTMTTTTITYACYLHPTKVRATLRDYIILRLSTFPKSKSCLTFSQNHILLLKIRHLHVIIFNRFILRYCAEYTVSVKN